VTAARTSDLWWKNAIVYCLDVETFRDHVGDGVGDLEGLTDRIDYLAGIGVTCLWLMPFYATANRDDGYDVTDHYAIDPRVGSLGDFVACVRTAKDRGLRVIVDLVVNHTSDRHPWFQEARSAPDAAKRDWYIWADEPQDEPDNDVVFPDAEDSLWSFDDEAGQWYLHHFYSHQPDLNTANPAVREEIAKIAGFWLQLGIDGFRVDAVPYLIETGGTDAPEGVDPHELLRDLRSFTSRRRGDSMLLGEVNLPPEDLVGYFGDDDQFHMLFDFPLMQSMYLSLARGDARPLRATLESRPTLPEDAQWAIFVRNHDELTLDQLDDDERSEIFAAFGPEEHMQLYGRGLRRRLPPMLDGDPDWLRLVYSLQFSLPGTPVLFYGEEIGMGDLLDLDGRMSVRTPMQWTAGPNGGFCDGNGVELVRPLPAAPYGPEEVNVADQRRRDDSLLTWMERMIRLRKETPEFGWGTFTLLDTDSDAVMAHRCDWEGGAVMAVHHLGPEPVTATVQVGDTSGRREAIDLLDAGADRLPVDVPAIHVELGRRGHRWFRLA
jgi:trehalose synthase